MEIVQYAPALVFCPFSQQLEGQRVWDGVKFCAACGGQHEEVKAKP